MNRLTSTVGILFTTLEAVAGPATVTFQQYRATVSIAGESVQTVAYDATPVSAVLVADEVGRHIEARSSLNPVLAQSPGATQLSFGPGLLAVDLTSTVPARASAFVSAVVAFAIHEPASYEFVFDGLAGGGYTGTGWKHPSMRAELSGPNEFLIDDYQGSSQLRLSNTLAPGDYTFDLAVQVGVGLTVPPGSDSLQLAFGAAPNWAGLRITPEPTSLLLWLLPLTTTMRRLN